MVLKPSSLNHWISLHGLDHEGAQSECTTCDESVDEFLGEAYCDNKPDLNKLSLGDAVPSVQSPLLDKDKADIQEDATQEELRDVGADGSAGHENGKAKE